jgi:flagellar hook-basal body complex protein FliE
VIVPAISGVATGLGTVAGNISSGAPETLANAAGAATPAAPAGVEGAPGSEGTPGVEVSGLEGAGAAGEGGLTGGGGLPSFGSALTDAISSLEEGQQNAAAASQALATGKVSDPEAAVTTVEDAALEMQLAAQIRSKATEAAQTIFQTQV